MNTGKHTTETAQPEEDTNPSKEEIVAHIFKGLEDEKAGRVYDAREVVQKLREELFYSEKNIRYLEKVAKEMDEGINVCVHDLIEE